MKIMQKYRGKTLEEWRKYINEDKQAGIRATKYILVLEELVEELQSKLHQPTVSSCACGSNEYYVEQYKDVTKYYCKSCHENISIM